MNVPMIIGLTGLARCGKDTFCKYARDYLKNKGYESQRLAFADELKKDIDDFLIEKLGISAFTEVTSEKEIIRPMLTTWGTEVMRKQDDLHWVKKVETSIVENQKNNIVSIVTDIRFPNEIEYIHKIGGKVVHLTLVGNEPANDYEREYDPQLKNIADCFVMWRKYGEPALEKCMKHVKAAVQEVSE
jgi:dephospho-CoA kinase